MNQEKLAKLQAQVRIGGKVWIEKIHYFAFTQSSILAGFDEQYCFQEATVHSDAGMPYNMPIPNRVTQYMSHQLRSSESLFQEGGGAFGC